MTTIKVRHGTGRNLALNAQLRQMRSHKPLGDRERNCVYLLANLQLSACATRVRFIVELQINGVAIIGSAGEKQLPLSRARMECDADDL